MSELERLVASIQEMAARVGARLELDPEKIKAYVAYTQSLGEGQR